MALSGIYRIVMTNKCYVGSGVDVRGRILDHKRSLEKGDNSRYLQRAWNKYGERAFRFETLLHCDKENLLFYEQLAIDFYKSANSRYGYNLSPTAGSNLGYKHSREARDHMSAAHKGKKHSKKTTIKMTGRAPWNKDKTGVYSRETRRRISEANMGNAKRKGKKFSRKSRRKMSESHRGQTAWNKGLRGRQVAWNKGKPWSEEMRKKLSEAHIGYKMPEEQRQKISRALKCRRSPTSVFIS